jgi:hypothetical protein
MGCGGSTDKLSEQRVDEDAKNESRKPRISVRIDPEVRLVEQENKPRILFVFGKSCYDLH